MEGFFVNWFRRMEEALGCMTEEEFARLFAHCGLDGLENLHRDLLRSSAVLCLAV